jgi:hypothetical protein
MERSSRSRSRKPAPPQSISSLLNLRSGHSDGILHSVSNRRQERQGQNSDPCAQVTQSSFADPCTYLAANGSTPAGFDSGLTSSSTFSIAVTNDAERTPFVLSSSCRTYELPPAIWFFCKSGARCGSGMVGYVRVVAQIYSLFSAESLMHRAMNAPTSGDTYGNFLDAAKNIGNGEFPVRFPLSFLPQQQN